MQPKIYNFAPGPAMLPEPVMQQIQQEFLNYHQMGVSIVEISHRSKEFMSLMEEIEVLFRELTNLPDNYHLLFMHGGGQMQFSAVPLNLMKRTSSKQACYIDTGNFSNVAIKEAQRFLNVKVIQSSAKTQYNQIPQFDPTLLPKDSLYLYLASNNTVYGTQWHIYPETHSIPLVIDATSDILSRQIDFNKFGIVFAGAQKNLGVSGLSVVIIRKDLLNYARHDTPKLLSYQLNYEQQSLPNTINTFAMYCMNLILKWMKAEGGLNVIEKRNQEKAALLYQMIDQSEFYQGYAQATSRSQMNVTFKLPNQALEQQFLTEALANGLYALKGHRVIGGIRASIYNAMPLAGVQKLIAFMQDFEQTH